MHLAIVPTPEGQPGLTISPCCLCGSSDQVVEDGGRFHCGTCNFVFKGGNIEWDQHLHRRQARQAELAAATGDYPPLRRV